MPTFKASPKTVVVLMALSVLVISFAVYFDVLDYFFTATDTLTLIDVNRIHSPEKIIEIFTSPLMAGTSFAADRSFYRPITSLTYGLDYFLWGLIPFGYHLTDLVLHASVCVLVFFTLLLMTNGRKTVSWMSAVLFAIHPILVENVPAISRRQDTLAALFLLISLLLFLSVRKQRGMLFLVLSLVSFCLALGSKETAALLPALLFVYLFLSALAANSDGKSIGIAAVQSMKKCLPHIVVAVVYIVWRGYVLGGMGGYGNRDVDSGTIWFSTALIRKFFSSLMFPVAVSTATAQLLMGGWSLISVFLLVKLCLHNRAAIVGVWRSTGKSFIGDFRRICAAGLFASVIGILSHPLYIHLLNGLTAISLSSHRDLVPTLVLFFWLVLLISSLAGLLCTGAFKQSIVQFLSGSEVSRIVIFFAVWLLSQLAISLATQTFQFWYMYIPAIPFSALVSIALIEPVRHIKNNKAPNLTYAAIWSSFTAACLIAYLISFSPLLKKYGEWKDSGKLSSIILNEISRVSAGLPPGATMHIYGLPEGILSYSTETPRAQSVRYLNDYSIKSWLDLTDPGSEINVVVDKYSVFESYPVDINLDVQVQQDDNILVVIEPIY